MAIEPQAAHERISQPWRIRKAAFLVISGRAGKEGLIPFPQLPAAELSHLLRAFRADIHAEHLALPAAE